MPKNTIDLTPTKAGFAKDRKEPPRKEPPRKGEKIPGVTYHVSEKLESPRHCPTCKVSVPRKGTCPHDGTDVTPYLNTLPLVDALWWFIGNTAPGDTTTTDLFFYLRARVRTERAALSRGQP